MPGLTSGGITPWSCDAVFQYDPDNRWCVGYAQFPDATSFPQALGVVIIAHGGGWIASSKINDWRVGPTSVLVDEATANFFLALGIAVVWIEYPPGWQTTANARVVNPSRFPQIPRALGRCKQFLMTHATDGYVTRSTAIKLPEEDFRYGIWGASAGAIMALWIAMQPDGYLDYAPMERANKSGPWAYTASHRVGWVLAIECATDLRRYGESASALPYYHWAGRLFKDTANDATIGRSERLDTVPVEWKGASSCIVALESAHRPNLDVAVMISNGAAGSEATYANSGLTVAYADGALTGVPVAGETCTFSGGIGGTATFLYHDTLNNLLHFDILTGTFAGGAIPGEDWTGSATFATSGASVTAVSYVAGTEARPNFLTEAELLAIWDADDLPVDGITEHSCGYLPAWKRERLAQYAANPDATNNDRIFCGFPYTATVISSGYDDAGFGWGSTVFLDETQAMLEDIGVLP